MYIILNLLQLFFTTSGVKEKLFSIKISFVGIICFNFDRRWSSTTYYIRGASGK